MTNPQQGWNEWNRDGRCPSRGRKKGCLMQMVLGSPTSPGVSKQSDFAGHPHHLFLACLGTVAMATQVSDWMVAAMTAVVSIDRGEGKASSCGAGEVA